MVPGAPCQPRSRNDTGMHSGVMFLSKFPARALPHAFDDMTYSTARIQVLGMAVADTWVTVGMLYGLPCNASHKQARYQTDALLAELVDRVACQTVGPRAIGGDFNYGPEDLDQITRLQALGVMVVRLNLRGVGPSASISFGSPLNFKGHTWVPQWLLIIGLIMPRSVLPFRMMDFRCRFLLGPVLCNFRHG